MQDTLWLLAISRLSKNDINKPSHNLVAHMLQSKKHKVKPEMLSTPRMIYCDGTNNVMYRNSGTPDIIPSCSVESHWCLQVRNSFIIVR